MVGDRVPVVGPCARGYYYVSIRENEHQVKERERERESSKVRETERD